MQVEHKTEKGTVLFYLLPENTITYTLYPDFDDSLLDVRSEIIGNNIISQKWTNVRLHGHWSLIGLTTEATEDQCEMMVDIIWNGFKNYELSDGNVGNYKRLVKSAVDSFKSLMQHLQVYDVNPYGGIYSLTYGFNRELWQEAESRSGKWIVLFKPNEK